MAARTKIWDLTAAQWRALAEVAREHPRPVVCSSSRTCTSLVRRGLVEWTCNASCGFVLTEDGKHVYARLSVGPFCRRCGIPLTFAHGGPRRRGRVAVAGGFECEPCGGWRYL